MKSRPEIYLNPTERFSISPDNFLYSKDGQDDYKNFSAKLFLIKKIQTIKNQLDQMEVQRNFVFEEVLIEDESLNMIVETDSRIQLHPQIFLDKLAEKAFQNHQVIRVDMPISLLLLWFNNSNDLSDDEFLDFLKYLFGFYIPVEMKQLGIGIENTELDLNLPQDLQDLNQECHALATFEVYTQPN